MTLKGLALERLGQNVSSHLSCGQMDKPQVPIGHSVLNEEISNVDMPRALARRTPLLNKSHRTHVVLIDDSRTRHVTLQDKKIPSPEYLTTFIGECNQFSFC